jgi:hypothetical protein
MRCAFDEGNFIERKRQYHVEVLSLTLRDGKIARVPLGDAISSNFKAGRGPSGMINTRGGQTSKSIKAGLGL